MKPLLFIMLIIIAAVGAMWWAFHNRTAAVGLLRRFEAEVKADSSPSAPSGAATDPQTLFADLRNRALVSGREGSSIPAPASSSEPWGVIIDLGLNTGTVTVAAYADGSARIYLSSGGAFSGGQDEESIQQTALALVHAAAAFPPRMTPTNIFPLPQPGQVNFYLRTDAGVLAAAAPEAELAERTNPLETLFYGAQKIITQYRLNQDQLK